MKIFVRLGLVGLALSAMCTLAFAFPDKPITLIVPAPPGGTADTVARTISAKLAADLGQAVIVENKAGASGVVASEFVAHSDPNGYTLLMNYTSHATNPWLMPNLPYDSVKSFAPVAFLGKVPLLLAVPASGPKTAAALIADAREHPGTLSYGTSATGGASHLGGALFSELTGAKMMMVPYKGGAAAAMDLAAGRISMLLDSRLALQGLERAGRIRYLGVSSTERSAVFPNLQPIGKELPGFDATAWFGVMAPAGTPTDVVRKLNAAINQVLMNPRVRQTLISGGFEPQAMTPSAWAAFLASETKRWGALIHKAHIHME